MAEVFDAEKIEIVNSLIHSLGEWAGTLPQKHPDVDPMELAKLGSTALSVFVAQLAVDVLMPKAEYLKMSEHNFNYATEKAQKWGQ